MGIDIDVGVAPFKKGSFKRGYRYGYRYRCRCGLPLKRAPLKGDIDMGIDIDVGVGSL